MRTLLTTTLLLTLCATLAGAQPAAGQDNRAAPAATPRTSAAGVFVSPSGVHEPVYRDSSGRLVFANGTPLTMAQRTRVLSMGSSPAATPRTSAAGVFVSPSGVQEDVYRDSSARLVFANGTPLTTAQRTRVREDSRRSPGQPSAGPQGAGAPSAPGTPGSPPRAGVFVSPTGAEQPVYRDSSARLVFSNGSPLTPGELARVQDEQPRGVTPIRRDALVGQPAEGYTAEGYVLRAGPEGPTLSNGAPYRPTVHGRIVKAPRSGLVEGRGIRAQVGPNSVERLEFPSAADARSYVMTGLNLAGSGVSSDRTVELRGNSVLIVDGPGASSPRELARLRTAAWGEDTRRPDVLATRADGVLVVQSRARDASFEEAFVGAERAIVRLEGVERIGPNHSAATHPDGSRSEVERGPGGFRSVTHAGPTGGDRVRELAEAFESELRPSRKTPRKAALRGRYKTSVDALKKLRRQIEAAGQ